MSNYADDFREWARDPQHLWQITGATLCYSTGRASEEIRVRARVLIPSSCPSCAAPPAADSTSCAYCGRAWAAA